MTKISLKCLEILYYSKSTPFHFISGLIRKSLKCLGFDIHLVAIRSVIFCFRCYSKKKSEKLLIFIFIQIHKVFIYFRSDEKKSGLHGGTGDTSDDDGIRQNLLLRYVGRDVAEGERLSRGA